MVRPKRFRQIFQEPRNRCFKPDSKECNHYMVPIEITLDEYETIRLKDHHNIKQKKAAEIMDISQPTFHRTLISARRKIAGALIEGKAIKIKGGILVTDKERYKCKNCGFEWYSPGKEYYKCPDCESEDIYKTATEEQIERPVGQSGMGRRRGHGGGGFGAGPPRVCKCTQCDYESPKTPGVPCRNTKCPECGAPLCGAD